jgi:hypothetical protein
MLVLSLRSALPPTSFIAFALVVFAIPIPPQMDGGSLSFVIRMALPREFWYPLTRRHALKMDQRYINDAA